MNDINTLMQRMEEINTKAVDELSADDIDTIIAYHRRQRQRKANGEKIGVKASVDLSALIKSVVPQTKINIGKRL